MSMFTSQIFICYASTCNNIIVINENNKKKNVLFKSTNPTSLGSDFCSRVHLFMQYLTKTIFTYIFKQRFAWENIWRSQKKTRCYAELATNA